MKHDFTDQGRGAVILPFTASPAKAARFTTPNFRMGAGLRPAAGAGLAQAQQMLDCAGMMFGNDTKTSQAVITSAACPNPAPNPAMTAPIIAPPTRASRPGAPAQHITQRGAAGPLDAGNGPATDRDALSRRIVSIHLTDFAIARWLRWAAARHDAPPDDLPVVLAAEGAHGPVVTATNRAATLAGLHIGARVVDMRALCPQVRVVRADPDGDRAALDKLMLWARRWCPWTAVDGADGIVMDTTGSDHLWGGEAAMLREIEGTLGVLGFSTRLAMAPTHGAAWALARYGAVRAIATPQTLDSQTAPLPARALRLDGDTVLLLQRLGLKSIGDLAAVPRASLARRFATAALTQNPLLRLDQLQGRQPEPVNARTEPPRFAVQARLPEPVQDPTPYLAELCDALCETLAKAGHGARKVTVTVYRTDAEVSHVTAATARASRDPNHLRRLFDDRLDRIDPGFGFELITLEADTTDPLQAVQSGLDGRTEDGAALAQLVDRLSARLGPGMVRTPSTRASHIPERSLTWMLALAQAPGARRKLGHISRPLRLLDTPEEIHVLYAIPEGPPVQFRWRRVSHRIAHFHGPERIAPEWWTDRASARLRDYYRIEDDTRRRLWIYRDGIYGEIYHLPPQWFMHGVFG
ncbi:MAG: protein ImuB [Loktanella salsilacus]|jgi:protein ImuB